jgi:predicted phage tail protein
MNSELNHPFILNGGTGGGKGGSSGRSPTEVEDNLKSRSYANLLLGISEGPVFGFTDVDPLKQIYLDGTPIRSASGNLNFKEVYWEYRQGTPEQQPTTFNLGRIRSEIPVEVFVKANAPVVRTVADPNAVFLIVRVRVPALFSTDDKGNINNASINYRIELSVNNGPYQVVHNGSIVGKTNSVYEESKAFELPPNSGNRWDVRLTRVTPDSTSLKLQNDLVWASYQINERDVKTFPNVNVLALRINSDQFSSIPSPSIYQRGLIVRTPHNYSSSNRVYSGSFNGSLIPQWTNNPAWLLWAVLTNDRWGCGILESQLDVWSFYDCARYNDELIPAGGGTFEPRYTFNAYLNSAQEAFDAVAQIASSMRSQVWWNGSRIILTQDRPSLPVRQFNPANVIYEYDEQGRQTGGGFSYASTDVTSRYTSVLVRFIDPNTWEEDSVLAEDPALINQWGFRQLEMTAVGCTSRSQAQRTAKWELYTSTRQTEVCSFKVASEGLLVNPGEVIYIQNPHESGESLSGRITSASSNTLQLDYPLEFQSGLTYELITTKSDGTLQTNPLVQSSGLQSKLSIVGTFGEIPASETPWIISKPNLKPELFQVVRVSDEADGTFTIESVNYAPSKYDFIERDSPLVSREVSSITKLLEAPPSPINLQVTESLEANLLNTVVSKTQLIWGIPPNTPIESYQVEYRRIDQSDWIIAGAAFTTSFTTQNLPEGNYQFRVLSKSTAGRVSEYAYTSATLFGLTTPPLSVESVNIAALNKNQVRISWNLSQDIDVKIGGLVRIRHSPKLSGATWSNSTEIGSYPGSATNAIAPLLRGTYLLKFVDSGGRESLSSTAITTAGLAEVAQNVVASLTESPTFSGQKSKCFVENGFLKISRLSDFISAEGLFTPAPGLFANLNTDKFGVAADSTYEFSSVFDAGKIITARIWGDLELFTQTLGEEFTDRQGLFAEQLGLFAGGGDTAEGSATIQVATSSDGSYSNWQNLIVGEYTFRFLKFRLLLKSYSPSANIAINKLRVNVDAPDISQNAQVSIPYSSSGTRVNFSQPFIAAPSEVATVISPFYEGESVVVSNIDATGFNVRINYSNSVAASTRTLNWFATSY